jgi:hypothetical protein
MIAMKQKIAKRKTLSSLFWPILRDMPNKVREAFVPGTMSTNEWLLEMGKITPKRIMKKV